MDVLTGAAISKITFDEFVKSGAGEVAKKPWETRFYNGLKSFSLLNRANLSVLRINLLARKLGTQE